LRVDGEVPEVDVGLSGMAAVLDLGGSEAANDGPGTGGKEGEMPGVFWPDGKPAGVVEKASVITRAASG
jgi:hypothetical protein